VVGVSPVLVQMWQGVSPVLVQMWQGASRVPVQMWHRLRWSPVVLRNDCMTILLSLFCEMVCSQKVQMAELLK
jgi:hypothetical protein